MRKKTYSKPDFTMMRFSTNDSVATCPTTENYNEVTVNCIISGTHDVFYGSCDSNYSSMRIVTVTSDVSLNSAMDAINYLVDLEDGTIDGNYKSGNYTLSAGTYMIWTSGQTHAGLVSPDITSTVNSSL